MFDKVLLISEGYPVYYGKARESMDYFSSLRFTPDIAMNPAEFLLDLATGQVNDIRVPEDLHASQGSVDSERVVIKVSNFFILGFWLFLIIVSLPLTNIYLCNIIVSTTQVQNLVGAKRKRREPSDRAGIRATSVCNSS